MRRFRLLPIMVLIALLLTGCGKEPNSAPSISSSTPENPYNLIRNFADGCPTSPITFSITASDPDGDPLSYSWACSDGTGTPDNSPNLIWTPPLVGSFGQAHVSVNVSDPFNSPVSHTWTVTILDPDEIYYPAKYQSNGWYYPPDSGTMKAAIRLPQNILAPYVGKKITHVIPYISSDSVYTIPVSISLCHNLAGAPGLVISQINNYNCGRGFNQVPVTETTITSSMDLWVVVELTSASQGKILYSKDPTFFNGNWLKLNSDPWTHLNALASPLYGNWLIRVKVID